MGGWSVQGEMMRRLGLVVMMGLLVGGCWSDEGLGERPITPVKGPEKSLYERLGQEKGIRKIVDEWVARSASNPRVNFVRNGTTRHWTPTESNVAGLKAHLVEFLCERSGGPQRYEDRKSTRLNSSH